LYISVWIYYVITLMPVLGIVQVGLQSMADRYTYLPSLGSFLIPGLIAAKVYRRVNAVKQWRVILNMASLCFALGALVSISYATVKQIGVWRNSIVLWNYVLAKAPAGITLAHYKLGEAYYSNGQLDRSIEQYETALRLKPDYAEAHNNLGGVYAAKGHFDRAAEEYQTALRLKPDYAEAYYNLGGVYAAEGHIGNAIAEYQTALRLKPDFSEAQDALGIAYGMQGRMDKAIAAFKTALRLKPDFVRARYHLAFSYLEKDNVDMAKNELEAILAMSPDFRDARQLLNDINSRRR
jgi:tetratricopeptide (TPR) repeat protein